MSDKQKNLTLRDKIRQVEDITKELIEVPEWNCTIEMRSPTSDEASALEWWAYVRSGGAERDAANDGYTAEDGDTAKADPGRFRGMKEMYIICCAYDPDSGRQLFSDADSEWLREKNAAVISRLWEVANRLTGLTEEEASDLGKTSEKEGAKSSGST